MYFFIFYYCVLNKNLVKSRITEKSNGTSLLNKLPLFKGIIHVMVWDELCFEWKNKGNKQEQ